MRSIIRLNDWMTTPQQPFFSKITNGEDDRNIFHSHTFYEIFYIVEGTIEHDLNGTREILKPGDIFFLNQDDVHAFLREPGNPCKHRDIVINPEAFEAVCRFISPDFFNLYNADRFCKQLTLSQEMLEHYEGMIARLVISPNADEDRKTARWRTVCAALLGQLLSDQSTAGSPQYPAWFEELLGRFYMPELLKAGLDSILEPYHFDRSYICRTFRHYMGCTMTDHLNSLRLQQAASLLQYSTDSVLSISGSVGFSSISYFNTIFKKKYGISPKQFRRQQKMLST